MIASLGMYDRAETAGANDALWAGIRKNLGYGPPELDRTSPVMDIWQSPDLLFSQTCGMPYRLGLHALVQLVGTPDYGIPDTAPGYYYSVFLVRTDDADDLADYHHRVFAYNGPTSQSGWAAAQNHVFELGFQFENLFCSGGHLASAAAVASGRADVAALDAVSWRMICEHDAGAGDLKAISKTMPTPGLPFITAAGRDAGAIYDAAELAIDRLHDSHRQALGISGMTRIDAADYMGVRNPATP